MKRLLLAAVVAALAGCASSPAPILRAGQEIAISTEKSQFDAAGTRKSVPTVAVAVQDVAPRLDRSLFASRP